MGKLLMLLGGTTLALAVFAILNAPDPVPADGVGSVANRVSGWGAKQRVTGAGGRLKGRVEQGLGNLTGNPDVGDRGVLDEAAGAVKSATGQAAQAVGSTIRDLNR